MPRTKLPLQPEYSWSRNPLVNITKSMSMRRQTALKLHSTRQAGAVAEEGMGLTEDL